MEKPEHMTTLSDMIDIMHFTESLSIKIQGLGEDEIFKTVKKEFLKSKRYDGGIFLLSEDGSKLKLMETSLDFGKFTTMDKMAGLKTEDHKIDLNKTTIFSQIVREGKTVQVKLSEIVSELLQQPMTYQMLESIGYEKKLIIMTPLARHGKISGAFFMTFAKSTQEYISLVKNLALHISYALEIADEKAKRKSIEEKLNESEQRFHCLVDDAGVAIAVTDLKGRLTYVNKALVEWSGYSLQELLGRPFKDFIHPDDRERIMRLFLRIILLRRQPRILEYRAVCKDGSVRYLLSKPTRFSINGKTVGFHAIILDVTERKRMEEELKESEAKYSALVEQAKDAVIIVQDGVFKFANKAAEEISGYSVQELVGMPFTNLLAPESMHLVQRYKSHMEGARVPSFYEVRIRRKDGTVRDLEISTTTIRYKGRPADMAIARDISERKKIEEMKSKFITKVTHELKTPMSIIKSSTSYLRSICSGELTEDVRKMLEIIERNSERLAKLTDELIDLRMIEEGRLGLKIRPVNFSKILKESIQEVLTVIQKRNQRINFEIQDDLPLVLGDSTRLSEVIYNLLDNASKFTPEGGSIVVRAMRHDDEVLVEVSDTGIGINKEDLEIIFEPFSDVKKPDYYKGMGIGLNICKEIIQMHGGKIWAESEGKDKGSRFIFTLPIAR